MTISLSEIKRRAADARGLTFVALGYPVDTTADSHCSVIRLPTGRALSWTRDAGVLRMNIPSIVPNDRLDKDFYLVLEDFRAGPSFRETDEGITYIKLIDDLLTGQYDNVIRVVAFNPVEGWSRDASEDVANALEQHIAAEGREVSEAMREFIEGQTGRRIGQQMVLFR